MYTVPVLRQAYTCSFLHDLSACIVCHVRAQSFVSVSVYVPFPVPIPAETRHGSPSRWNFADEFFFLSGSASSQPLPGGSFPASAQPSTQTNSLFGGNTTTSQPQAQTPSLFGGSLNQQQQQQQTQPPQHLQQQQQQQPPGGGGGGLFGAGMAASSQPSLFGSNIATAGTGGGGAGLFGGAATSQPQQTGGGLFGSTTTSTAQPAQGGGGGLFNNAQNTGGSLFGGGAGNTNTGTSSLFGQKPAQPGGLFGGQAATQPAQATSGGILCVPSLQSLPFVPLCLAFELIDPTVAAASADPQPSSNQTLLWAPP